MQNKEMHVEFAGELSAAEAALAGAFPEDALSAADALASVNDEALSPAEMLAAPRLTDKE